MTTKRIAATILVLSLDFFYFLKSEHVTTDGDLDDFQKWFEDHGGRCRCRFMKNKDQKLTAVADREIVDKESVLMVPQSLHVNSATVERYFNLEIIDCYFYTKLLFSFFRFTQKWITTSPIYRR